MQILNIQNDFKKNIHQATVSAEAQKAVFNILQSSEVTWQSPSMKDRKIIRTKGQDSKVQKSYAFKRYMLMSYREAYATFLQVHPEYTIRFSKFHSLNSSFVEIFKQLPYEECICKVDENMHFLLHALHTYCHTPTDSKKLLEDLTCDPKNEKCVMGLYEMCTNLIDGFNPEHYIENPEEITLKVTQWVLQNNSTDKKEFEWNVLKCFLEIKEQIRPF